MLRWSVAIELQDRPFVLELQAQWIVRSQLLICNIIYKSQKPILKAQQGWAFCTVFYIKDLTKQLSFCGDIFRRLLFNFIIFVCLCILLLSFITWLASTDTTGHNSSIASARNLLLGWYALISVSNTGCFVGVRGSLKMLVIFLSVEL